MFEPRSYYVRHVSNIKSALMDSIPKKTKDLIKQVEWDE